ncbi:DUF1837 domain-containing protein [Clostridium sp. DJ247]|uniref:HamA C-terminal domain-containing protein n=1 Tax=Clostridium sp. DJ247 TaxID=2726188 RepID=UPI0016243995|nr:DUF1837 domain-containing protein [Clostridium sp. DJ247]MBC2579403.1 DUF1837 domain-containing protein [Clostridium sp. DJ247]
MELSLSGVEFLDSFDELWTKDIDKYGKNKLSLFVMKINANQFNYDLLTRNLLEPIADYSISRKVKEEYSNRPMTLSKKAREKFVDYARNNGELGEVLLYCFLESHLHAPKILTKLELKTSTSHYVNGADGIHFIELSNGNYQLIFGEAKTIEDLTAAISDAFKSIYEFKNGINEKGNSKSGIIYERGLISDNLTKETFSDKEKKFIEQLIYPQKDNEFEVDDAFGIFVGFQIEVTNEDKKMPNDLFRDKIKKLIDQEVSKRLGHIIKKIDEYELQGHNFYIYVLPFTDMNKKRKEVMGELTK